MEATEAVERAITEKWSDEEVVKRVLAGETALYEIIMRRYNQRLYRVARAILRNDAEAEDVMQDAYVKAYEHLAQFEGRSAFSSWLTRIAVHEALARAQKRNRVQELDAMLPQIEELVLVSAGPSPEQEVSTGELTGLLEEGVLALPEMYRTVLIMRDIEEMSTAETASALDLTEENVKVRLHRGRAMLRKELYARAGIARSKAFAFMGARCDLVVANVFSRLTIYPDRVAANDGAGNRT